MGTGPLCLALCVLTTWQLAASSMSNERDRERQRETEREREKEFFWLRAWLASCIGDFNNLLHGSIQVFKYSGQDLVSLLS